MRLWSMGGPPNSSVQKNWSKNWSKITTIMSSEVFEEREEDFHSLSDDVRQRISYQLPKYSGEERKKHVRELERKVEEGNLLIQEMEQELKKAPSSYRSQMLMRVRNYRREMDQFSRDLRKDSSSARGGDFGANFEDDHEETVRQQRNRLFEGSRILDRTSESIARSHRIAAETDDIGTNIIGELGTQREQLTRTRDRLHDTDDNLKQSRTVIKGMARRALTNKLLLIVIIILEVCILGGVIYWKFFS